MDLGTEHILQVFCENNNGSYKCHKLSAFCLHANFSSSCFEWFSHVQQATLGRDLMKLVQSEGGLIVAQPWVCSKGSAFTEPLM